LSDIVAGKKAKVKGILNTDKKIVAKEIEVKKETNAKFEGLISAIDTDAKTIVVFGEEIAITNSTTVKDERDATSEYDRHFFNFNNLSVGDHIEVSYYQDDASNLIASKLELKDIEVEEEEVSNDADDTETVSGAVDENTSEQSDQSDQAVNQDQDQEIESIWQIKGTISAYDSVADTIEIDGRTIDISNITDFIGNNAVDNEAEIKGTIIDNVWVATKLEVHIEEADEPAEKHETELEN
jgi:hypothetical protein